MPSSHSVTTSQPVSRWFPELDNRALVYVLITLGLIGTLAELASARFVPRMVLYSMVLGFGVLGLARCRRARLQHHAAPTASARRVA